MKKEKLLESFTKEEKSIKLKQLFLNLMVQVMRSFLVLIEFTQEDSLFQDLLGTLKPNFKSTEVTKESLSLSQKFENSKFKKRWIMYFLHVMEFLTNVHLLK